MDPSEPDRSVYERGLEVRRDVLGAEHVDRSLQTASDFSLPMQRLVTE
jgi:4-carboxymuconolactone decarboxylase